MAQRPPLSLYNNVCTVIILYCIRFKSFQTRLLLSKVRLEVEALEIYVIINQDCIANEIK